MEGEKKKGEGKEKQTLRDQTSILVAVATPESGPIEPSGSGIIEILPVMDISSDTDISMNENPNAPGGNRDEMNPDEPPLEVKLIEAPLFKGEYTEDVFVIRYTRPRGSLDSEEEYEPFCECAWLFETFKVSPKLQTVTGQRCFFAKVLAVKTIQMIFINSWILFQELTSNSDFPFIGYAKQQHDYVFIAFFIFLLIHVTIRSWLWVKKRPISPIFTILAIVTLTICVSYLCTSLVSRYRMLQKYIWELTLSVMCVTFLLTLLPLYYESNVFVTKLATFGKAAFASFVTSFSIMLVVTILDEGKLRFAFSDLPDEYFPLLFSAEFMMLSLVLEMRLALVGRRFKIDENDWLFVAILM